MQEAVFSELGAVFRNAKAVFLFRTMVTGVQLTSADVQGALFPFSPFPLLSFKITFLLFKALAG